MTEDNTIALEGRLSEEEVNRELAKRIESEIRRGTAIGKHWSGLNLYAVIRDLKKGFYSARYTSPSWLFPLPAEGNFQEGDIVPVPTEIHQGFYGSKIVESTTNYLVVGKSEFGKRYVSVIISGKPNILEEGIKSWSLSK